MNFNLPLVHVWVCCLIKLHDQRRTEPDCTGQTASKDTQKTCERGDRRASARRGRIACRVTNENRAVRVCVSDWVKCVRAGPHYVNAHRGSWIRLNKLNTLPPPVFRPLGSVSPYLGGWTVQIKLPLTDRPKDQTRSLLKRLQWLVKKKNNNQRQHHRQTNVRVSDFVLTRARAHTYAFEFTHRNFLYLKINE